MKNALSISFALLSILGISTLQIGEEEQNMNLVAILLFVLILFATYMVDIKKIFSLSNAWCNVLIILVVLGHFGVLRSSPIEFIAFSIANILAYILAILFFKKKDYRVRLHLLTLSLILACVSSVSRQDLLFSVLMFAYFFSLVITLSLLFLDQEKEYYETHAFVRPPFGLEKTTTKTKTPLHLIRLALGTLFLTPFFLLFGYRPKDTDRGGALDANRTGRRKAKQRVGLLKTSTETSQEDRIFGFWESAEEELLYTTPYSNGFNRGGEAERRDRFIQLRRPPIFSGSSHNERELSFSPELIQQITIGLLASVVFAFLIFFFFPRFNRLEIGGIRFGLEGWKSHSGGVRKTVGFNETIYLGELGPTYDNHQAVLTVKLWDIQKDDLYLVDPATPLYLRGTTLVHYSNRRWSRLARPEQKEIEQGLPVRDSLREDETDRFFEPACSFFSLEAGKEHAIYDQTNDLVRTEIRAYPINSPIIFAFWPFFRVNKDFNGGNYDGNWFVNKFYERSNNVTYHLYTNAFRKGEQLELIPNQEEKSFQHAYLELDHKELAGLVRLARNWDQEANLLPEDRLGRARNIMTRLRDSGQFTYNRLGVSRDRDLDPLEDFVIAHREGHCEFFAGALAMMLRAIGIPSRIVIGFKYYPELNTFGTTTVRQSDAHSWVEALILPESLVWDESGETKLPSEESLQTPWWNHGGWFRLDPTPYSDDPILTAVSKGYQSWTDFLNTYWDTYVLNFNNQKQRILVYDPCLAWMKELRAQCFNRHFWTQLPKKMGDQFEVFFFSARGGHWDSNAFWGFFGPLLLLVFAFGFMFVIIRFSWIRLRRRGKQRDELQQFLSTFYGKLEVFFARWGIHRLKSETSREFVLRGIEDPKFDAALLDEIKKLPLTDLAPDEITREKEKIRHAFRSRALETVAHWYQDRFGIKRS